MSRAGAQRNLRALPLALGLALAGPGAGLAQHAYTVGPPNEYLRDHPMGPPHHDTDADRSCVGGYNSEAPYAHDTCLPGPSRQFTMTYKVAQAGAASDRPLDRVVDLPKAISACWRPDLPPPGQNWQITARLAFSADGRVIGQPRITYFSGGDMKVRARMSKSLLEAFGRCAPLRFTHALGSAIAGRPIAIRFILQPAQPASGRGGQNI